MHPAASCSCSDPTPYLLAACRYLLAACTSTCFTTPYLLAACTPTCLPPALCVCTLPVQFLEQCLAGGLSAQMTLSETPLPEMPRAALQSMSVCLAYNRACSSTPA